MLITKHTAKTKIMKNIFSMLSRRLFADDVAFWSLLSDSNQRPRDYKSRALAN